MKLLKPRLRHRPPKKPPRKRQPLKKPPLKAKLLLKAKPPPKARLLPSSFHEVYEKRAGALMLSSPFLCVKWKLVRHGCT
jgi:hypothetical protein